MVVDRVTGPCLGVSLLHRGMSCNQLHEHWKFSPPTDITTTIHQFELSIRKLFQALRSIRICVIESAAKRYHGSH
nr:hypothetical protein CFP56_04187 [Quercus suber]